MSLSSIGPAMQALSPASPAVARQIPQSAASPKASSGGAGAVESAPFNHRSLIEGLQQKLRAQVLTEKNLSAESLNAMGSEQRRSTEAAISDAVDLKLRETMVRRADEAAASGQHEGALLNLRA